MISTKERPGAARSLSRPAVVLLGPLQWAVLMGLLVVLGVGLAACANPVPPSGGPRDETPPSIVTTRPARDSVNVSTDTRSVYVEFSEYIERSTLSQALTITPQFDGRIRYDWSGQGVSIELPRALRDSTTYIFSFDTNLSDARGVSLDQPVTVAFATGPRINQGALDGTVVGPRRGEPQSRVDVFAYGVPAGRSAPPPSLPDRPDYRTQTGEDGTFSFRYLRERRYYVVALRDNNRNRQPDPAEPFAVPPRPVLAADSGSTPVPVPWLLTRVDTLAPTLRRARPLSRQRLRLSFSEPVELTSRRPADWALRDSAAQAPVPVQAVYGAADRADAVILRTAPMDPARHVVPLTPGLVADTLGRPLRPDTARFRAVDQPDTTRTRFRAFVPEGLLPDSLGVYSLLPGTLPGVRLNEAPDSSTLRRAIALRDTSGQPRPYTLSTEGGRTYRLRPDTPLRPDRPVDVVVNRDVLAGPDTTLRRRFRRVSSQQLGALEGRAVLADTTHPAARGAAPTDSATARPDTARSMVVELVPTESTIPLDPRAQAVPPGSTFVFSALPEGAFRFRAFLDRNGNGRWDGGTLRPFRAAEPVTWSEGPTESRPRWTNVLPAPLRVPLLRPPAQAPPPRSDTTTADSLRDGP